MKMKSQKVHQWKMLKIIYLHLTVVDDIIVVALVVVGVLGADAFIWYETDAFIVG
jgi:hypothetical protein